LVRLLVWRPGRKGQLPIIIAVPVDGEAPGETRVVGERQRAEIDCEGNVYRASLRHSLGPPDLEVTSDLDRLRTVRALDDDGAPVLVDEEKLPVMGLPRLVPAHIHLYGDRGRHRVRPYEAPTPAEDEELPVRHLRRVTEHHGHTHGANRSPARNLRSAGPGTVVAVAELGLRNDIYRRPLATALERLGLQGGWRCADVGAGAGDVSVALAELVGREGRVYAVDSDPRARDAVATAAAAAGGAQVVAITQAGEDLALPESVDLAYCRFLLLHVLEPRAVLARMALALRPGGFLLAQEPITSAGRIEGAPMSMPEARHPDVGALLPGLVREVGLELVDAWAEAPAGAGPGPVAAYLGELTGVDPEDASVVLPPLVTVIGRRNAPEAAVVSRPGVSRRRTGSA